MTRPAGATAAGGTLAPRGSIRAPCVAWTAAGGTGATSKRARIDPAPRPAAPLRAPSRSGARRQLRALAAPGAAPVAAPAPPGAPSRSALACRAATLARPDRAPRAPPRLAAGDGARNGGTPPVRAPGAATGGRRGAAGMAEFRGFGRPAPGWRPDGAAGMAEFSHSGARRPLATVRSGQTGRKPQESAESQGKAAESQTGTRRGERRSGGAAENQGGAAESRGGAAESIRAATGQGVGWIPAKVGADPAKATEQRIGSKQNACLAHFRY